LHIGLQKFSGRKQEKKFIFLPFFERKFEQV
jgi:hypothetical protein